MHFGDAIKKQIAAQLKVAEKIYGADVLVFAPTEADVGVRDSSPVAYETDPIYSGKLLIPQLIINSAASAMTQFNFTPDAEYTCQSVVGFPKYSKIIVTDDDQVTSLTISYVNPIKDADKGVLYFQYELTPSTTIPTGHAELDTRRLAIIADEDEFEAAASAFDSIDEDIMPASDPEPTPMVYKRIT